MSTAVTTVQAHPDKCEKDFDAVVAILTQYIRKEEPTPSVKVAFVTQTRSAKWQMTSPSHGTFKGKIEFKKCSREEYDPMSTTEQQQLNELWYKAGLLKKKKTPESSKALEARVATLEAKTEHSNNDSLFLDEKPKIQPLTKKGSRTKQSHAVA